jgi:hypothetical protein
MQILQLSIVTPAKRYDATTFFDPNTIILVQN